MPRQILAIIMLIAWDFWQLFRWFLGQKRLTYTQVDIALSKIPYNCLSNLWISQWLIKTQANVSEQKYLKISLHSNI